MLVSRALCFFWSPVVVTVRLQSKPSGSGDENVQIRSCVISARKQNILTSQPCLHTLMQTRQTRPSTHQKSEGAYYLYYFIKDDY